MATKVDGRTQVRKATKGYLMMQNPGKTWAQILEELLNKHGSRAAAARALGMTEQSVRDWARAEMEAGNLKMIEQPRFYWKAVR